jgi:broad specificity phosphatase PhoE/ubiquinone/menaquinone biosynthesis C-methylase UbiE
LDKTTLIFTRHGESLQNRGDFADELDSGLTELGWRQAMLVADWLARTREVHAVISSPMRRARQTAELIGRRLGLPFAIQLGLEEASRSYWNELPAAHQSGPMSAWDDCWLPTIENAPAYTEFRSRLRSALASILAAHAGRTVVIVAHGGSIGTILRSLFSGHAMPVFTQNTGVTELTWNDEHWQLAGQNLQEHLSPLLTRNAAGATGDERFPWNSSGDTQALQAFYRSIARAPGSTRASPNNGIQQSVEFALTTPIESVLDVGCGTGALALALAPHTRRVIGIDASAAMLERAELRRLEAGYSNLDLIWAHAADLPLPDSSFDLVAARDLWIHLRSPQHHLGESRRVLHPSGHLFMDELIGSEDAVRRATQEAIEVRRNPTFARLWTPADIKRILSEAGFDIERWEVYHASISLDDWMSDVAADEATRTDVRSMMQAGMEEDATGLRVRQDRERSITFTQSRLRLLARYSVALAPSEAQYVR